MDAITYLREKERLTKCSTSACNCCECRLDYDNNGFKIGCDELEGKHPEEAVRIIEEWSKEIDWTKVEKDAKVLVSNYKGDSWIRRHFAKYKDGKVWVYERGGTSYTSQTIESFEFSKLFEG